MDSVRAVLRSLRLTSSWVALARMSGRWGFATPPILRAMIFHGVVTGRCVVRSEAGEGCFALDAGDIAFLPHGGALRLFSDEGADAVPLGELTTRTMRDVAVVSCGSPHADTRIVCAKGSIEHPGATSVLDRLPALVVSRPADASKRARTLATLALLEKEAEEAGGSSNAAALLDAVFVSLVSECAGSQDGRPTGILAAARDEKIGRALALVHGDPAGDWNAQDLAAKVGMSRSRFFERFTELLGEPPARYVARWRVLAAADLLRERTLSTQEIAERVGYSSDDALARAFKRLMGVSVGEYRRLRPLPTRQVRPRIAGRFDE